MVSGNGPEQRLTSRRIALLVQYDGTAFNGWQIQPEGRSVQCELETACRVITGSPVATVASGRTDAGVHALGQVVHFDTGSAIPLHRLCTGLNGILPRDVSVINAYDVPADFNARFGAVKREYRYIICNTPQRSPFMMYRAAWISRPLDTDYLNEALSYCVGEHDFSSFCKQSSAVGQNTVRTVHRADAQRKGDVVDVTICGNAFLHNMVRSIVGTVLELHKKKVPASEMVRIRDSRNRQVGGETAPAYGLYLRKVDYNPPLNECPAAHDSSVAALFPSF